LSSATRRLQVARIREPHWHPSAGEINLVTSGVATGVVIDGNGNHENFDQHVGDIVFAPQRSFHYFENRGPGDLKIVIIQNTSAPEDKDTLASASASAAFRRGCCLRSSAFPKRHSSPSRRSTRRS
jgi:oxalate decarboxylase/phosphoglucose isomerase-like protein (cupin superfamily)